jgi:hypothetical protein
MATGNGFNKVISETFDESLEKFSCIILIQSQNAKVLTGIQCSYGLAEGFETAEFASGRLVVLRGEISEASKGQLNAQSNALPNSVDGLDIVFDAKIGSFGEHFFDFKNGIFFSEGDKISIVLASPLCVGNTYPSFTSTLGSLMVLGQELNKGEDPYKTLR